MATITIHTRGNVYARLARLPREVTLDRAMLGAIGTTILEKVHDAFLVKSQGDTDESGLRWKPLSPFTIAYKRKHAGVPYPGKKRAKLAPSAALKTKQRSRWWTLYYNFLKTFKGNKGRSAAAAWRVLKGEGATTLMDRFGSVKVPILVQDGNLLKSLVPPPRGTYGRKQFQVFRISRGMVEVGTSRPWSQTHQHGAGSVPQRRLWPAPRNWPLSWWTEIGQVAKMGVVDTIIRLLGST